MLKSKNIFKLNKKQWKNRRGVAMWQSEQHRALLFVRSTDLKIGFNEK